MSCQTDADGAIDCLFRIPPREDSGRVVTSAETLHFEDCPIDNEGSTICVEAVVLAKHTRKKVASAPPETLEESTNGPPQRESRTLRVGEATYRPPYAQYGSTVATVLRSTPVDRIKNMSPSQQAMEWANFFVTLGTAHYPAKYEQDEDSQADWHLAVNAYQQALVVVPDQETSGLSVEEYNSFVAMVNFRLGEAYLMTDPETSNVLQALEYYLRARQLYQGLLKDELTNRALVEQNYANTCTKLGMAYLMSMSDMDRVPDWMSPFVNIGGNMASTTTVNGKPTEDTPLSKITQAQEALDTAISVYRRLLGITNKSPLDSSPTWEFRQLQLGYGLALQQAAAAITMEGQGQRAKELYDEVITLYRQDLLPALDGDTAGQYAVERENTIIALADLYLSRADACVQLGDYQCGRQSYQLSMEWHDAHGIEVAAIAFGFGDEAGGGQDDIIEEHMEALREYRRGTKGMKDDGWSMMSGEGDYEYAVDDGYEGDLLSSLGSLYLSMGEASRARSFLQEAISKYGKERSRAVADAKINLAMVYYHDYQFDNSRKEYHEALDIYQELYGDGVNPFLQDMQEYQEMYQDMPPNVREGMGSMSNNKDEGDEKQQHSKVIDVDQYRQSIQNFTQANRPEEANDEL